MSRRILQIGITAILVVLGILVAARSAEPSVRPVLWPPRTTVVEVRNAPLPDPVETTTSSTSTTTSTTTSEPPATTTTSTTTSEPPTTTTTTTTEPPPDEPAVDELAVLAGEYGWYEQGDRVRDLQALLGLSADGVYGGATRAAHLAEVQERGLAADGIP
ncbi:MAG: peptidoglycan-binding domain-containing protein, partial [Acidimicrobiales bacterium]|nr:peptidoglycan-binding domain-containing protein [Acidimicrobiales bacterium]